MDRPSKLTPSQAATLVGIAVVAVLPFVWWSNNYFVADDWAVLTRNSAPVSQIPGWFVAPRAGWFRPLFDLYIAANVRLFGFNPLGYHVASLVLYVAVTGLVGRVGMVLSDDRRIGLLAALIFAVHACHSQAVMWIAAANELLAALFALGALLRYFAYRRTGQTRALVTAFALAALALLSKETALFLPLAFLAYDGLLVFARQGGWGSGATPSVAPLTVPGRPCGRDFLPALMLLALFGAVALARPPAQLADVSLAPVQLVRNFVYNAAMLTVALPARLDEILLAPWSMAAVGLAVIGLLITAVLVGLSRAHRVSAPRRVFTIVYGMLFAATALAPVVFVVAERTLFMATTGIATAVAALFVGIWESVRGRPALQTATIIALVLWLSANALALVERNVWWGRAGATSRTIMAQLDAIDRTIPAGEEIWLVDLPDRYRNAYVFRNAFPAAGTLLGHDSKTYAILDTAIPNTLIVEAPSTHGKVPVTSVQDSSGGFLDLVPEDAHLFRFYNEKLEPVVKTQ